MRIRNNLTSILPITLAFLISLFAVAFSVTTIRKSLSSKNEVNSQFLLYGKVFQKENITSCGISALRSAAEFYKVDLPEDLVRPLQVQANENLGFTKMSSLQSALSAIGILSNHYRASYTEVKDVLQYLSATQSLIVHSGSVEGGHFLSIFKLPSGSYRIKDERHDYECADSALVLKKALSEFSGNILLLYPSSVGSYSLPSGIVMAENDKSFNSITEKKDVAEGYAQPSIVNGIKAPDILYAFLNLDAGEKKVPLLVKNCTRNAVVLEKVYGSCSCFRGIYPSVPVTINADSEITFDVMLSYDRSRKRPIKDTAIILQFADKTIREITIKTAADGDINQPFLVANEIFLGIVSKSAKWSFLLLQKVDPLVEECKIKSARVEGGIRSRLSIYQVGPLFLGANKYFAKKIEVIADNLPSGWVNVQCILNFEDSKTADLRFEGSAFSIQ